MQIRQCLHKSQEEKTQPYNFAKDERPARQRFNCSGTNGLLV